MIAASAKDLKEWRVTARQLLARKVPPEQVVWSAEQQACLFDSVDTSGPSTLNVPRHFMELASIVAYHRDVKKWTVLYRTLWRICIGGERNLLQISSDSDVRTLMDMRKHITRDAHKMKAFIRFRKLAESNVYIAWHEPMHPIVEYTAPFFMRRFKAMVWGILTPDKCVWWDGHNLTFHVGVTREKGIAHDDLEELWLTFYQNIFNPARVKTKMMKSEMPVKYWHTMPETALIAKMLSDAPKRVEKMMQTMQEADERASDQSLPV